ncbi:hypothetical protein GCM10020331_027660 [Ectobacillus funiculus]
MPMQDGVITDETRIRAALPTIQYLAENGAKVILASHFWPSKRTSGRRITFNTSSKAFRRIAWQKNVIKTDEAYGPVVQEAVAGMSEGDVLLLENVRFFMRAKKKNDPALAKEFAALADLYVNDAFGAAHRAHASTAGIAEYIPAVSGFLMEKKKLKY